MQVDGSKFFTLIAEEITWELVDGIFIQAWGYNGSTLDQPFVFTPVIVYVFVSLIDCLKNQCALAWLNRPEHNGRCTPIEPSPFIEPGHYFDYHFTIKNPPGTYMYHSHVNVAVQDNAGLLGGLIVEDPNLQNTHQHRDYLCLLQEWAVDQLPWGSLQKVRIR